MALLTPLCGRSSALSMECPPTFELPRQMARTDIASMKVRFAVSLVYVLNVHDWVGTRIGLLWRGTTGSDRFLPVWF